MLLSAIAGATIVLTAAGDALVCPLSAFVVGDGLGVVGHGGRLAVRTDACPVQRGRVTGVGPGGGGV